MEIKQKSIKGFTLIELMIVTTMISIMAGMASGLYLNYLTRAKTSEAVQALGKMVEGEVSYYQKIGNFLEAGPTNIPPGKQRVIADFAAEPRWKDLNFEYKDPIYFGYQAVSLAANEIDCEALGDLDGDGSTSIFRRSLSASTGQVVAGGIFIFDELE